MRCAIIRGNIIFYIRIPENLRIFRNFFHGKGRYGTRHLLCLLPTETAARRQKCILRFGPHSREKENWEHPQMFPIFVLSIEFPLNMARVQRRPFKIVFVKL